MQMRIPIAAQAKGQLCASNSVDMDTTRGHMMYAGDKLHQELSAISITDGSRITSIPSSPPSHEVRMAIR